ncbi:hypothetical protein PHLGIDRAFT_432159 [Phlebiopsis gigantea 11061_1 CR5-6]|uniref:F-box domain-containing protein n=1 Tax=Phlebiopsis gigantea (strain 11061_1 CR5-6) TaxID=745531 RepID=A0A0C3PKZ1_PHLG1|nr:hypothetical protein PHLGIDRAFT_432159 [Phlebiopsis gigantea 11061_1 CR5-6]
MTTIAAANMAFSDSVRPRRELLMSQILSLSWQLNEPTSAGLPPELLSHIFTSISPYEPRKRTSHGILGVAQACHYWRQVALQNPQLWTHIELDRKRSESYIQMMFERSRQYLLDVSDRNIHELDNYELLWPPITQTKGPPFFGVCHS